MPYLSVFVTSPNTHSERRFDSGLTVQQLKDKLTPVTGISPQYQVIKICRSADQVSGPPLAVLDDDSRTLASYGLEEWNCITVDNIDPNYRPGEFTDESNLERFELSPEEYAARSDTVLAHLKANKLGRFADTPTGLDFSPPPPPTAVDSTIVPGKRCEVSHGEDGLAKRGTVRFVGEAKIGKGGAWVGVELDEPLGKGDGEIEGTRYFSCLPKHAVFVRSAKVTVGDFPEEDIFSDDEI
ncbi:tubulin-folding cofactor B [Cryptococcus neoformans]|nr:tubulin-folding cofactor B [Cryptococcus neoformans var. grubii]OXC64117.1 tubulin-folding cofactor B [Cryptococcus neoformans var. grubii MW-RSA852]